MSGSNLETQLPPQQPKYWLKFRTTDDGIGPISQPASISSPTTFPKFAQLPPELRLKIWEYLIQPRIVVIGCLQDDSKASDRWDTLMGRRSHSGDESSRDIQQVPVLLHINQETRVLALKHYELAFSWRIRSLVLADAPVVTRSAQVYFNFDMDCLLLKGELEAYDDYGYNTPMVYFLRKDDTKRVRHVACAFKGLGYLEYPYREGEEVCGCLWHVVDRFPAADRLLLTVEDDNGEWTRDIGPEGGLGEEEDNVVQKLWRGWIRGVTVTNSRMKDKQMLMVQEAALAEFVNGHQT